MKTFGIILFLAGALLCGYALTMDTSVPVNYNGSSYGVDMPNRVVNLGLMQERQNYLIVSGVLMIAGVIMMVTAKPSERNPHLKANYKPHYEFGKKEEYKGNIVQAIDHYCDALYELETNYHPHSHNGIREKNETMTWLKNKIQELKNRTEVKS